MAVMAPVGDGPAIVVCTTCRPAADGPTGGETLLAALRAESAGGAADGVAVQAMACLFACDRSCAVHLRAPGRIGYVLGGFAPDASAAGALLAYAVAYAASEHGEVAYRDWPDGVKGRFLARIPPAGFVVA